MQIRAVVIDDYEPCRYLLSRILKTKGYEVLCLPDTSVCPIYSGVKLICSRIKPCCDLILTDNRMPKITGIELLKKQNNGGCKVPIENKAIVSGSWSQKELSEAKNLGCKIFIKPYDIEYIYQWTESIEKNIPNDRILSKINF